MSPAEQELVLAALRAATVAERRSAIHGLRSGARLSLATKGALASLASAPASAAQVNDRGLAHGARTLARRPWHGPIPQVVEEWVECWKGRDRLEAAGLSLPPPLLLRGNTGTGKSTLAAHLALSLSDDAWTVSADQLVRSHMGETSSNVRTIARATRVVVIEEVDVLGAERDFSDSSGASREWSSTTTALFLALEERTHPTILTTNAHTLDAALVRRVLSVQLYDPSIARRRELLEHVLGEPLPERFPVCRDLAVTVPAVERMRRLAVVRGCKAAEVPVDLEEGDNAF